MAGWYNSVVADLGKIVDSIEYYEKELEEAKYECSIKGSLEKSSSVHPALQNIALINSKRLKRFSNI